MFTFISDLLRTKRRRNVVVSLPSLRHVCRSQIAYLLDYALEVDSCTDRRTSAELSVTCV